MDRLRPAPEQKAFADKNKDKLSLEDQDWVEKQLEPAPTAGASPAGPAGYNPPALGALAGPWGLRASLDFSLINLQDLTTYYRSLDSDSRTFQVNDPSISYQSSVPGIGTYVELNPFYSLGNMELGLKFSYLLPISATYSRKDSYGYAVNFKDDLSAFSLAADARFYFPMGGGVQFFLEPILGFQPVHMDFNIQRQKTAANPPNDVYGFHMDDTALDTGLKMGFQFMKSNHFTISLVGGWEYVRADNLRGTYYDAAYPNMNGVQGQAVVEHDSYYNNDLVWFLPDDSSKIPFFYGSSGDNKSARPLVLDFSGIRAILDFAYWF